MLSFASLFSYGTAVFILVTPMAILGHLLGSAGPAFTLIILLFSIPLVAFLFSFITHAIIISFITLRSSLRYYWARHTPPYFIEKSDLPVRKPESQEILKEMTQLFSSLVKIYAFSATSSIYIAVHEPKIISVVFKSDVVEIFLIIFLAILQVPIAVLDFGLLPQTLTTTPNNLAIILLLIIFPMPIMTMIIDNLIYYMEQVYLNNIILYFPDSEIDPSLKQQAITTTGVISTVTVCLVALSYLTL
ncbi:hypothetical protein [Natronoarchaeum philippinense]|uniref:hypothetical protein n=1 Tax=Natronoarchaeum philippinense TaxID=558529 RepID=UPI00117F9C03|nr:hypothetical protein [Natronoarchaeum philippinense]